jgi:transitional endoplasmic reticulum ATPase
MASRTGGFGSIVKVRRVDIETQQIWYDRPDGGAGWFWHPATADVDRGQVLFLPADVRREPPQLLPDADWPNTGSEIGTVLRISDDGSAAAIEIDGKLRAFPQRDESPFADGQTVVITDTGEPGEVLSKEPIDRLGLDRLGLDREPDRMDPKNLWVEPDSIDIELSDFGGSRVLVERAFELATLALDPRGRLEAIGVNPIKGILFSGPSGTGKTHLARALSRSVHARFYLIDGPEIINKYVGESERRLRDLFDHAEKNAPSILFFDELDSIVSSRGPDAPEYASSFVGQFLTALDGFEASKQVLVIAATNLPGQLDSALLRPGRLSFKLEFNGHPNADDRAAILRASARDVKGKDQADWTALVEATEGWSAAELAMIWTEAGILAVLDDRPSLCAEDIEAGLVRAARNREVSHRQIGRS